MRSASPLVATEVRLLRSQVGLDDATLI
jgi:hypothetical protein